MTGKNFIRAVAITALPFVFMPCAQASGRTWYVNHNTSISNIQNNVNLNLSTATNNFLDGDNVTFAYIAQNVYELDINQSPKTIGNLLWCDGLSPIVLEPGAVSVGDSIVPATLILKPTTINTNISYISLGNADSQLILDSSSLAPNTNNVQVLQSDSLGSYNALGAYTSTFIRSLYPLFLQNAQDNYGHLELHSSTNHPLGFSIAISTSPANRLKSLTFSGNELIEGDVSQAIHTKNINFDTSGNVILPQLIMGEDSAVKLQTDLKIGTITSTVSSAAVQGSLSLSGSSIIDLDKYKFNIIKGLNTVSKYAFRYSVSPASAGLVVEAESAEIKTFFDPALQGGAGDGGRFILEDTTKVQINNNMTITLNTNASAAGLSYNLFSGAGTVDVPIADRILGDENSTTDFTLVSNKTITFNQPAPAVIYWTYDPNGHVISSHIKHVQSVPPPNSTPGGSPISTPNPSAPSIRFTDTSVLPPENITAAVARIVPSSSGKMATDEANDTAIRDVATRMFKIPEDDAVSSFGISSGEVEKQYSGVWFSSFIQRARQKDTDSIYGYKIRSYGGTLGADRMFGENFALGIAWTALNTKVKLNNLKVGDGASVNTNIFSIYSLYNLPYRWFIQSHASAGQSNIKSKEWRYRSDNSLGLATAAYKSYTQNIQTSLGKRIHITPLIDFIPSIGMVYNNARSDGYAEKGDVPIISVAKRSGYALDALFSTKLYGRYDYEGYTFKPELSASAQLNMTKSNVRMNYTASFLEPSSQEVRQSKVWYSAGAGLTVYKGLMEYAFDYEAQFDKGYMGHVGMIKIRMNF